MSWRSCTTLRRSVWRTTPGSSPRRSIRRQAGCPPTYSKIMILLKNSVMSDINLHFKKMFFLFLSKLFVKIDCFVLQFFARILWYPNVLCFMGRILILDLESVFLIRIRNRSAFDGLVSGFSLLKKVQNIKLPKNYFI